MSEAVMEEQVCVEQAPALKPRVKSKRDIFRFQGQEDMTLNLEHVYKIVKKENKVTFQCAKAETADFVEFESEEIAKRAYEQIITIWAGDVLE